MSAVAEVAARATLWWIDNRPFSPEAKARRQARRAARKAARHQQPDDPGVDVQPKETEMALVIEILGSLLRTSLPVAVTYLHDQGVNITGDSTTTIVVAVAVWAGMQVWSIVRKVIDKPRATGTPSQ